MLIFSVNNRSSLFFLFQSQYLPPFAPPTGCKGEKCGSKKLPLCITIAFENIQLLKKANFLDIIADTVLMVEQFKLNS